jgi:hypothetical protein
MGADAEDRVMKRVKCRGRKKSAWNAAEEQGYDMSLIESNLRKTPYERIRAHGRALATAVMLRKAMEKRNGRA